MNAKGPLTLSKQTGNSFVAKQCTSLQLDETFGQQGAKVFATSPTGRKIELEISDKNGVYTTDFKPDEIGDWNFSVSLPDNGDIAGSPFSIRVFDPKGVSVLNLDEAFVGEPKFFDVDTSKAGSGTVGIKISHDGSQIPSDILMDDIRSQQRVTFVPTSVGTYEIKVFFAGNEILGSPFKINAVDLRQISVNSKSVETVKVNKNASFNINFGNLVDKSHTEKLDVQIIGTRGNMKSYITSSQSPSKTLTVNFNPSFVGEYEVKIFYSSRLIGGVPFRLKVYDLNKVKVILPRKAAILGSSWECEIDVSEAGPGRLELSFDNEKSTHTVQDLGRGHHKVTLYPKQYVPHLLNVKFNGENIPDSPFRIDIDTNLRVTGGNVESAILNKKAVFNVSSDGTISKMVSAKIKSPSGKTLAASVKTIKSGSYQIEYIPEELGKHEILLMCDGKATSNQIKHAVHVFDPSSITISPTNQIGAVGEPLSVVVDVSKSGKGKMEVSVLKGSKDVVHKVLEVGQGMYQVTFTPSEVKPHTVRVSFNGVSEENCSLIVPIIDKSLIKILGEGVSYAAVNQKSCFKVIGQKLGPGNLSVNITSMTDGSVIPATVKKVNTNGNNNSLTYSIEYSTTQIGDYRAEVKYNDLIIGEGPFVIKSFDPRKVKVTGIKDCFVGMPSEFSIDAAEAGEGNMVIAIESVENKNHKCANQVEVKGSEFKVKFTPSKGGQHKVNILYNDKPIAESPFSFDVFDMSAVSLKNSSIPQDSVQVNKNVNLFIGAPRCDIKDFSVTVKDPANQNVPVRLSMSSSNEIAINFLPIVTGNHIVEATYKNHPIIGFPKIVKVWDASKIKVSEIKPGRVNKATSFEVDASKAGGGQIEVSVTSTNRSGVPISVTSIKPGYYAASFTPTTAGQHKINIMFNGELVPGGLQLHPVIDSSKVKVTGEGLCHLMVDKQTGFEVNIIEGGIIDDSDLSVNIYDPSAELVASKIQRIRSKTAGSNVYQVSFTPRKVGQHKIEVKWAGFDVGGSPFAPDVFDVSRVHVNNLPHTAIAFKTVNFDVDTGQAGNGRLEVKVKGPTAECSARVAASSSLSSSLMQSSITSISSLPLSSSLSSVPATVTLVSFEPREVGQHSVKITFENHQVPGSPFLCNVLDPKKSDIQWDAIRNVPINKRARLEVNSGQPVSSDFVSATVVDPTGNKLPCSILPQNTTNGSRLLVEFLPTQVGSHQVELAVLGDLLPGSPFVSEAFDIFAVEVKGLDKDKVNINEVLEFFVDTSKAGQGEMLAKVKSRGQNSQKIVVGGRRVEPNVTKFFFTPVEDVDHVIDLTFNKEAIPGFPKIVKVVDAARPALPSRNKGVEAFSQYDDLKSEHNSSTQTNSKLNYDKAKVIATAPNGEKIPAKLVRQPDGDYKIDYNSPYVGRHKIEVILDGEYIMQSPYYVDLCDASKVDILSAKQKWQIGDTVDFEVVTRRAGKANLSVKVLEPTGAPLDIEMVRTEDGHRVLFKPQLTGPYRSFVSFGGQPVPGGNPLIQDVMEPAEVIAFGSGLTKGWKDEPSRFVVDGKGQKGDLTVQVDGPNSIAKVNIESVHNGAYNITYVPVEVGFFDIFVKWNGRNINGSPFKPKIVDISKVKAVGGWDRVVDPITKIMNLELNQVNQIELDTKFAGPGVLSAEVTNLRTRNVIPVDVLQVDDDRPIVTFVPTEPGDYLIRILWEEILIPACPITGVAKSHSSSHMATNQNDWGSLTKRTRSSEVRADKVVATGRGLKEAVVNQKAEFIVDGTNAGPGFLSARFTGKKQELPVQVVSVAKNLFRCYYEPQLPGKHFVEIHWSGTPINGSPFEVVISEASNASKIICSGEGLKKGILGQDIRAFIDTNQAGPGSIDVHCTGPNSSASTSLLDLKNGAFILFIKPQEVGRHKLDIKFSGKHVPDSPFSLKISPPPDPSKVVVYGPGVRHGLLVDFRSHFFVDTTGAGADQLTVRVRGPKGAFCVDMQRDHQRDRLITCRYDPSETGDYNVQVKWSNVDVPGSPFHIRIVDTQAELEEAMRTMPIPEETAPSVSYNQLPTNSRFNSEGDEERHFLSGLRTTGKDTFVGKPDSSFYDATNNSGIGYPSFDVFSRMTSDQGPITSAPYKKAIITSDGYQSFRTPLPIAQTSLFQGQGRQWKSKNS